MEKLETAWIPKQVKGAESRYLRQFQHLSNGHRINLNIKITAQNYRRTRTKHREDKKEGLNGVVAFTVNG